MRSHSHPRTPATIALLIALAAVVGAGHEPAPSKGGVESIAGADLQEWLTYLASDELEGRATFSEGLGLAAAYIAGHLREWGVRPGGDNGSYFQRVAVLGVKSTPKSTVTVEAGGRTRTFAAGQGITLPPNVGRTRTFTSTDVEFLGYGLSLPAAGHDDYGGRNVKNKVVVWLGATGPKAAEGREYRRALAGRHRFATDFSQAVASIGPATPPLFGASPQPAGAASTAGQPSTGAQGVPSGAQRPDFTTVERLDRTIAPNVTATDEFFEFLFAGAPMPYAELKAKADARDPLPRFALSNVTVTFNLEAEYQIVRTQYTRNVVGLLEGADRKLKDSFVSFGAHYDHVGYTEGAAPGDGTDRISNGADDDASGTTALMAVARAFALGPRPRRSLLFVWYAGEERGLWGSRFYVDAPGGVPLDRMVANLNVDMVGRNRDDRPEESNSVYPVGSDRISTELHNILIDANAALVRPLALDFEMNDPADLEQVYYRSDHYSFASKGVPIIFYTTGLHRDYHRVSDSADKINYEKLARVGQLVYETGRRLANLDHAPTRDNRGPRAGKGRAGKL